MKTTPYLVPCALALAALVVCADASMPEASVDRSGSSAEPANPSQDRQPAPDAGGTGAMAAGELSVTTGRLVDVDLDRKTLVVTSADGLQHQFDFSDTTEVIGASGVQGLADDLGDQISVFYREDLGRTNQAALRIEFQ